LPGFANFPGELLVLFGAWKSLSGFVIFAAWGALVIGAVYMLRAVRNIFHGPLPEKWMELSDAGNSWRRLPYTLLLASLLVLGWFPSLLSEKIKPSVAEIVKQADGNLASASPRTFPVLTVAARKNR
jgi:NADH-quinone oxidoreductase subunit M